MKTLQQIRESYTSYTKPIICLYEEDKKKEKKYNENNFAILQNIVAKSKNDNLKFKDESDMDCSVKTANSILGMHGRLTKDNQKKLINMIHQGKRHFAKVANFCSANDS